MIKKILIIAFLLVGTPIAGAQVAPAQEAVEVDENGWVWVPAHLNESAQMIEGFFREPTREGFIWVDPYVDEEGTNVAGHWEPEAEAPEDHVYVEGHRGEDGQYNNG